MTPEMFFGLLLFCSSIAEPLSLGYCVTKFSADYGLHITKQSLDESFNSGVVSFVKEILRQALELEIWYIYNEDLFPQFNIYPVKDSTKFIVDYRLEKQFKRS